MCTVLCVISSKDKTKSLLTPWKLGSINESKYGFGGCVVIFDWYLFQLFVLLKPDFNCSSSLDLFWVDKVAKQIF